MSYPVQVSTPSDCELLITRTFDAPRRLVFAAMSKPEHVRRWLLGPKGWTMPTCEIDFRVGGKYRYVWRNDDGRSFGMTGVFKEIVEPERIVATELFSDDWTGGETVNTTTLVEKAGKTRMDLLVVYASKQARDGAIATGMMKGVEVSYENLDAVLASMTND